MDKSKFTYERIMATIQAVAVAVLAVLVLFGVVDAPADTAAPVEVGSRGATNFDDLIADTFTGNVTGDVTGNVTGDVDGSAVLDTLNTAVNSSTLTGTQTISVTASYYQLAPASTLTLTLDTDGVSEGDVLILHNTVTTSTVVVDTGATVGGGNVTLGENDMAIFIFGNSLWTEIASPDNS